MMDGTGLPDRLADKIESVGECWEWTAAKSNMGYGVVYMSNGLSYGVQYAHRVTYQLLVGPIPDGLQLDHLCRNRGCVNPDHLEPVTPAENVRRGALGMRTECPQGHPLSGENLFYSKEGWRKCRTCNRTRWKKEKSHAG